MTPKLFNALPKNTGATSAFKYESISNNLSLEEVKMYIEALDTRRHETPTQKAIKGIFNYPNLKQADISNKVGASVELIKRAFQLERIASKPLMLDLLAGKSYILLSGKNTTSIPSIIKDIQLREDQTVDPEEEKEPNEDAKEYAIAFQAHELLVQQLKLQGFFSNENLASFLDHAANVYRSKLEPNNG